MVPAETSSNVLRRKKSCAGPHPTAIFAVPHAREMGLWHSWLARILDMDEVVGSNPTNPTKLSHETPHRVTGRRFSFPPRPFFSPPPPASSAGASVHPASFSYPIPSVPATRGPAAVAASPRSVRTHAHPRLPREGSGGEARSGRSSNCGIITGRTSSRRSASAMPRSSCGSLPATWSCGVISTSMSGSVP